ncbi:UNVERIFIED_CONTAM: hypothetical protein HDU68_005772 [Siphonaria sp. JEL0065]|nr:hypothetical protein HDU68_005772 [Siphonaria sp. JEL0065]
MTSTSATAARPKGQKVRKLSDKRAEQVRLAQAAYRLRKRTKLAELELKLQILTQSASVESELMSSSKSDNQEFTNEISTTAATTATPSSSSTPKSTRTSSPDERTVDINSVLPGLDLSDVEAVAEVLKEFPSLRVELLGRVPFEVRRTLQIRFAQRNFWMRKENRIKELEQQVQALEQRAHQNPTQPTPSSMSPLGSPKRSLDTPVLVFDHSEPSRSNSSMPSPIGKPQQVFVSAFAPLGPKLPSFSELLHTVNHMSRVDEPLESQLESASSDFSQPTTSAAMAGAPLYTY